MQGNFDLSCFQASYQSARQRFLDELAQVPAGLVKEHTACANPVPGPDGQEVYLDWLYLGQQDVPSNLLVLISGTHGVEGFAGSAVQSCWLSFLARQVSEDSSLGVVILHALNPWGFAWLRRYDHQGIDLNRNFIDFTLPLPVNEQYDLVHGDLFSDTSKPVEETIGHWQDQWGQRQFSSVVTRGQYRHDDGLFYGGSSPSWSRQTLEQLCDSSPLGGARRIAVIDLHTGLGPYGYGEVINDHEPGTPGFRLASQWYGPNAQSALLGESVSTPKSGLLDYFWHDRVGDKGCFVTLEYGTYSLDKLLAISCEEQRYHNSYGHNPGRRDIRHPAVTRMLDFFYPREPSWQEQVLFRAGQVITMALQGIKR